MSLFDKLFGTKKTPARSGVTFVRTEKSPSSTYEIYKADDAETAKAFLSTKRVEVAKHYILVETSEGVWGLDMLGLYLERLLAFQTQLDVCEVDGYPCSGPNPAGLEMAANGVNDSFVIKVHCGRCQNEWLDAIRYQNTTAVRCPNCKTVNRINSRNIHRVTVASYHLFEKFLQGCRTAEECETAKSAMSSISLGHEILALYRDDSFPAARHFAEALPRYFHPIALRFSDGYAIYIRCQFMNKAEYDRVSEALRRGCTNYLTSPDEEHITFT